MSIRLVTILVALTLPLVFSSCDDNCSQDFVDAYNTTELSVKTAYSKSDYDTASTEVDQFANQYGGMQCQAHPLAEDGDGARTIDSNSVVASWRSIISTGRDRVAENTPEPIAVPVTPDLPPTPTYPSYPTYPTYPDTVPSVPAIPDVPSVPSTPSVPTVPTDPGHSAPFSKIVLTVTDAVTFSEVATASTQGGQVMQDGRAVPGTSFSTDEVFCIVAATSGLSFATGQQITFDHVFFENGILLAGTTTTPTLAMTCSKKDLSTPWTAQDVRDALDGAIVSVQVVP
jgi:hypothetical protein